MREALHEAGMDGTGLSSKARNRTDLLPAVSAAELLEAWERGREASPGERGLLLLSVAQPELTTEVLSGWTVGRRDSALLMLRERIFGSRLEALAACPRCCETVEVDFHVSAITVPPPEVETDRFPLECLGYRTIYRVPTTGDLAELGSRPQEFDQGRSPVRWLLERCVVEMNRLEEGGEGRADAPCAAADTGMPQSEAQSAGRRVLLGADIPAPILDKLETAMAETVAAVDPQAEIELALTCPGCGLRWQAPFDIVGYLWQELEDWAKQLLGEVHILASRYGWSERDLLALSSWRRRHYLDLIVG